MAIRGWRPNKNCRPLKNPPCGLAANCGEGGDCSERAATVLKTILRSIAWVIAAIGINYGLVLVLLFLMQKLGTWGIVATCTIIPPLLIAPIWEWASTGNYWTFTVVYAGLGCLTWLCATGKGISN